MEPRIVIRENPPEGKRFTLKNPYTHYTPPGFDKPEYIFEIWWREKTFGGKRLVISKFIYDTQEECQKNFASQKENLYGQITYEIDQEIDNAVSKIQSLAKESRENYRRIQKTIDEFYPTGLMEYMERLRRKKWVKDKRKREKMKLMSMNPIRAEEYIKGQMEKFDKEEENV